jgi:hypothetical protein
MPVWVFDRSDRLSTLTIQAPKMRWGGGLPASLGMWRCRGQRCRKYSKGRYRVSLRYRGYTNKACRRRLDVLVRAGGLRLYSPRLPVCGQFVKLGCFRFGF